MAARASNIIGAAIREVRIQRRLSQTALAELAALDRVHVARIESGRRSPSLGTLIRFAIVLRVSPKVFFEGCTPQVLQNLIVDDEL